MLLKLYEENPSVKQIEKAAETLRKGGIIIYPTDTIYGLACDMRSHKAAERIAQIKGINIKNAHFSFICKDLSSLSEYTKQVNNTVFKLMKKNLPGPFTFILQANNKIPKLLKNKKKTVGIRIPDNNIAREIVRELGNPILSTSIRDEDEIIEYTTDPELIYEKYRNRVDIVINAGFGKNVASTIVDCTNEEPEIIRQGVGELQY